MVQTAMSRTSPSLDSVQPAEGVQPTVNAARQTTRVFAGLETPPATPDLDLDNKFEKLLIKETLQPIATPTLPPVVQRPLSPDSTLASSILADGPGSTDSGIQAVVGPPSKFHLFPLLPPELRLRIWELSMEPRVVELHTRRLHYADVFRHGGYVSWYSQCANPAALSACVEARELALTRYTVAVPLAGGGGGDSDAGTESYYSHHHHHHHGHGESHRRLYLDPAADTVALLGELDLRRLRSLLEVVRAADPTGRGVRRLGVSAACFKHEGSGPTLSMYARTVFRDLDELVLLMYALRTPPEGWSQGLCRLADCSRTDFFRRWEMTVGNQLKGPDGRWMAVGREKREIRIMDLLFLPQG